ncbi:MAG: hypothetical protein ACOYEH_01860 [Caldicoprobacterales bacterium]
MKYSIKIKRIYDIPAEEDGHRVSVDRLWPRIICFVLLCRYEKYLIPNNRDNVELWRYKIGRGLSSYCQRHNRILYASNLCQIAWERTDQPAYVL